MATQRLRATHARVGNGALPENRPALRFYPRSSQWKQRHSSTHPDDGSTRSQAHVAAHRASDSKAGLNLSGQPVDTAPRSPPEEGSYVTDRYYSQTRRRV